jgi:hypothetical protein
MSLLDLVCRTLDVRICKAGVLFRSDPVPMRGVRFISSIRADRKELQKSTVPGSGGLEDPHPTNICRIRKSHSHKLPGAEHLELPDPSSAGADEDIQTEAARGYRRENVDLLVADGLGLG